IVFTAALLCICVAVQAQDNELCRRIHERCLSRVTRNGRTNDVSDIFNRWCHEQNRRWRPISRCELVQATCRLTAERCRILSCENVREALDR
ncbi:hypothetical protein KR018_009127, partial [Drosophila ironensis]